MYLCISCIWFNMKDQGSQKGKNRKVESSGAKLPVGTEIKASETRAVPLTSKEKIAANQKNKKRR